MGAPAAEKPLVSIRGLKTYYPIRGSFAQRLVGREAGHVKAVDDISLDIYPGEVLGLVGESGSGKTTLGRTLLGLVQATAGSIVFDGEEITGMSERELRALRRSMQIVFQDPHASLNPAMTIEQSVGHPLTIHKLAKGREYRRRVEEALETVGLAPAEQFMGKYPSDLSGGQKQRAVVARAIILNPLLLVADEPVSMLDMSVRAKILELMLKLKREFGFTYLYITHDLATAKFFCDRIAILYLGRIVEIGPSEAIFADPKHPYTRALLQAIPEPDPRRSVSRDLPRGEVPDAARPPLGCSFHPRCRNAFEVCGWETRDLRDLLELRWAQMGEERYELERALIGVLDVLDKSSTVARLPAGPGARESEVLAFLESVRAETPDEPLWRGVRRLTAADRYVEIEFHEPVAPRLLPEANVNVECHLYDEDALREAERRRAATASDTRGAGLPRPPDTSG
ncbi:MAG: ABC transporter ATP-binding protein [Actinobacteria bacterium]|nr:ABC transporter ATP-binding protein [Actinomycetota bacterium]